MNQERVQAELENLEEKMTRAETSEDLWKHSALIFALL